MAASTSLRFCSNLATMAASSFEAADAKVAQRSRAKTRGFMEGRLAAGGSLEKKGSSLPSRRGWQLDDTVMAAIVSILFPGPYARIERERTCLSRPIGRAAMPRQSRYHRR